MTATVEEAAMAAAEEAEDGRGGGRCAVYSFLVRLFFSPLGGPVGLFFLFWRENQNSRSDEREEKTTKKQTDHGLTTPSFPPAPIK
jgi:hypothetical protein